MGPDPDPVLTFETSFEEDAAGFQADGTDLDEPPVDWTVERTTERAEEGEAAMLLQVDAVNDQAKIWMERSFQDLEPNTTYDVEVSFDFATEDFGAVNLWTLFADVQEDSPETWEDFDGAYTSDTGHGGEENVGYVWEGHTATLTATTADDGVLHVAIGVWATWETLRAYYVDNVEVTVTAP